uniref:Uncharacterized protein n=1 Tax=Aureoumbra lagunensis TaxID=44058 RepID=A0A7S3JP73_9STRA
MARGAFSAIQRVMDRTGFAKEHCLEAILAVSTRAFDLSHIVPGCSAALVPAAEIANHPSKTVVTPRFSQVPICEAVIGTCLLPESPQTLESGQFPQSICIRAPHSSTYIQPGDQLFNWYANAGIGEQDLDKYLILRKTFLTQYGFDPF